MIAERAHRRLPRVSLPHQVVDAVLSLPLLERFSRQQRAAIESVNQLAFYNPRNLLELLEGTGVRCPPITSYLDRLIDFVRDHFEGRQATAREADEDPLAPPEPPPGRTPREARWPTSAPATPSSWSGRSTATGPSTTRRSPATSTPSTSTRRWAAPPASRASSCRACAPWPGWPTPAPPTWATRPASKRLRVRFSRPVVVGDVVTFRGRCVAVEGPVVRLEVEARNQRGEEVLKGASAEGWLEDRLMRHRQRATSAGATAPSSSTVCAEQIRDLRRRRRRRRPRLLRNRARRPPPLELGRRGRAPLAPRRAGGAAHLRRHLRHQALRAGLHRPGAGARPPPAAPRRAGVRARRAGAPRRRAHHRRARSSTSGAAARSTS